MGLKLSESDAILQTLHFISVLLLTGRLQTKKIKILGGGDETVPNGNKIRRRQVLMPGDGSINYIVSHLRGSTNLR